ncbi:hypothetical protein [Pectobacterium zantedeschiae]|uniref:hypothetical protein n=1 Tax=Pectobacterium zantedeschiae TaxID=2034769 RepID=UPI001F5B4AEF|nr:hypothetical protein [Pectobacterium zantedeschiae]
MANLSENPQWVDGIYQIETSDPVVGGPDGVSNRQAKELASRTSYLKKEQEKTGSDLAKHTAAADPHTQYAPKENPTFTGTPKAPTPAIDSNSQQVATTAFVKSVGATKLAKDQNGADIQDKTTFYSNVLQRGTLGNGMTFASCDEAGDYVVAISDPNKVSDMPAYKGQKLYGYGVLHVSQRDNFVGQEYTNHSGDYAWRQKWDDGVYAPWVVALSSSRVPTATDVGALPENATAQAAVKFATPRTINGVPFDGTANITLTPANLGLGEAMNKGEFGWGGKAVPLPSNSKIIDYFKADKPSGLYWCNTTIADRPFGFSDCLLLWSVIQHSDFYGTLVAISFTPSGDDSRVRTATISTIDGLWGEWQYSWMGSEKGGVANAVGVTPSKPSNVDEYLHQLSQQQEMGSRTFIGGNWKSHISVRHLGGIPENGDKNNSLYGFAIIDENMLSNSYDISIYKQNNGEWLNPVQVYHSGNKPTASDVGAITKKDADNNYVRQGSSGVIYQGDELPWNSPTGAYLKDNDSHSSLIWHMGLNTGSASSAQFYFDFANGGIKYRSSRDSSGFEKPWARIYSDQDKPTATEIGALTSTEADSRYLGKGSGVQDIRLGALSSVNAWRGPGFSDTAGYVMTAIINNNSDEYIDTLSRRPIQKLVNGTWLTVEVV